MDDDAGTGDGSGDGSGTGGDGCEPDSDAAFPEASTEGCERAATDYVPGEDDEWPMCVSDSGEYTLVADTPSSIARVEAYEQIAELLRGDATPTAEDFTMARTIYAEDEGLESRVVRREDLHYPEIPMEDWDPGVDPDKQCSVMANVEKYPDRCAGPSKLGPILIDAFAAGQQGDGSPAVHAATIDATLLWFLYLSTFKEANTCVLTPKDCDSSWAYYTGGTSRGGGIGLAEEIRAVSPEANEAIWDGFLAFRCWRELYPQEDYPTLEDVPAEGVELLENARAQLDDALVYGFAMLVRDRLTQQAAVCGAQAEAEWAFLQIAGPVLSFEGEERDPATYQVLADLWESEAPTTEELQAGVEAIDTLFPCPRS